jgi:hypothetical protein
MSYVGRTNDLLNAGVSSLAECLQNDDVSTGYWFAEIIRAQHLSAASARFIEIKRMRAHHPEHWAKLSRYSKLCPFSLHIPLRHVPSTLMRRATDALRIIDNIRSARPRYKPEAIVRP